MEPDDAFLDALLSQPMAGTKAKVRVPGQPPPSADGELTAELRTSGSRAASVEIQQPSTGWSATVLLPVGELVNVESIAVQRSKRSGGVYLRYEMLATSTISTSAPASALEPEPEPEREPGVASAAAFRQARVNKLTASQQTASKSGGHAAPSASSTSTAVASGQFFAAGADALRASDGSDTEELHLWRRRFLRAVSAATRAVRSVLRLAIYVLAYAIVLFTVNLYTC